MEVSDRNDCKETGSSGGCAGAHRSDRGDCGGRSLCPGRRPNPGAERVPASRGSRSAGVGWGEASASAALGSWDNFDAMAKALNLTPTQLFEAIHNGKTLDEIAKTQGVDLAKVQEAANAARVQAMKDKIAQAVKDGKMTQEQADWLLQGLEKGYTDQGRGLSSASAAARWGGRRHARLTWTEARRRHPLRRPLAPHRDAG